jgi:hypothetical protein
MQARSREGFEVHDVSRRAGRVIPLDGNYEEADCHGLSGSWGGLIARRTASSVSPAHRRADGRMSGEAKHLTLLPQRPQHPGSSGAADAGVTVLSNEATRARAFAQSMERALDGLQRRLQVRPRSANALGKNSHALNPPPRTTATPNLPVFGRSGRGLRPSDHAPPRCRLRQYALRPRNSPVARRLLYRLRDDEKEEEAQEDSSSSTSRPLPQADDLSGFLLLRELRGTSTSSRARRSPKTSGENAERGWSKEKLEEDQSSCASA